MPPSVELKKTSEEESKNNSKKIVLSSSSSWKEMPNTTSSAWHLVKTFISPLTYSLLEEK